MQGAWRTVAERTQGFQSAGPRGSKEALEEAAWHVLALAKLRAHGAALEVLNSLGQLDAPEFFGPGTARCRRVVGSQQRDAETRSTGHAYEFALLGIMCCALHQH